MKVALTGGTGHLGASILNLLIEHEHQVNLLIRGDSGKFDNLPVTIFKGDINSIADLKNLTQGCEAVIHSAAVISINGDPTGIVHKTNVGGVDNIIQAALHNKVKRLVHISSIHAFQQKPYNDLLDEHRGFVDDKAFAYDRSKALGQQLVLKANKPGFETIVLNPTAMLGPPDNKPSLLGQALIDMYKGKIPALFDGGFDFCDVRDVANAIINALTMGSPGQNYLLGGTWYTMKNFAEMLSLASAKKIDPFSLPVFIARAGLPFIKLLAAVKGNAPLYTNESIAALTLSNKKISSEKAKKDLNYQSRPFEQTIADSFQWFKQNKFI